MDKILKILAVVLLVMVCITLVFIILGFINNFKLDYRCTNMPYSDFFFFFRCQEYWSMRHK